MLELIKSLLGITGTDKDAVLQFTLDTASDMAKGFCRIDTIPDTMQNIIVKIAVDLYRMEQYGQSETPQMVSSKSEGSRSVSYESSDKNTDSLIKNYEKLLKPFINRKGQLPSEL